MLEPNGASVDAIQRKPRLMSLRCIRVGSAAVEVSNPTNEALARRTREILTDTTDDLVKPPHEREPVDDTDFGAAARCFLGLEPGTEALDRRRRREKADLYTGERMSIEAMAKTQKKPYRQSHEHKLMDALAEKIMGREWAVLAAPSHRTVQSEREAQFALAPERPWMKILHEAWQATSHLDLALYRSLKARKTPGGEDQDRLDIDSLELFATFWTLIYEPGADGKRETGPNPTEPGPKASPKRLIEWVLDESPFTWPMIKPLADAMAPDGKRLDGQEELFARWLLWLQTCKCMERDPDPACRPHRVLKALYHYLEFLTWCWDEVRDPYHTPSSYGKQITPMRTLQFGGVRIPPGSEESFLFRDIDKTA